MEKTAPLSPTSKGGLTRQRILDSARRCFATHGYERTTIRRVAEEAEIDKSSVMKYFGTKENLFRECVAWDIPIDALTSEGQEESAQRYVFTMLRMWEADPHSPMAVLLRTSMTSELAASMLREHMTRASIDVIERHIDADEARLRAAIFSAIMMGLASGRHIIGLPDLTDADIDRIVEVASPMVATLLHP